VLRLGGELTISGVPDGGTTLRLHLPTQKK